MSISTPFLLVVAVGVGCSSPDFGGVYQVESYTLNEEGCDFAGDDIEPEYGRFEIRERNFLGVTIYPVYPCAESGDECAADNDPMWSLVTLEEDLDHVGMTTALSSEEGCVLSSVDLVIDGADGVVVLEQRTYAVEETPYDPSKCTADRAKRRRHAMECVALVQLVGSLEAPDVM